MLLRTTHNTLRVHLHARAPPAPPPSPSQSLPPVPVCSPLPHLYVVLGQFVEGEGEVKESLLVLCGDEKQHRQHPEHTGTTDIRLGPLSL